ncbi:MAG: hypothetical protein K8T26_08960 [Lentisphaerae bacterium]|nr:hypothetical protein [Lentisphaerota bacterium]
MRAFKGSSVLGVLAVLGGLSGSIALAQEQEAAVEPAATAAAGVDVVSAYVFRGATVNDEVNVQPTLEGAFYGVTLGTWGNLNTDSSQFDEIDYYASYSLPLGKCPVGLSVGYTEYTYPTATDEEGAGLEADREANVVASYDLALCDQTTLSTSVGGYFGIEGPYLDQGIHLEAASSLEYAVNDDVALNGGASVGAEVGDNYEEHGVSYVQLSAGASYSALSAAINYVIETDDEIVAVDEEWFGSVGVTLPL